jgi:GTPase KRas protein
MSSYTGAPSGGHGSNGIQKMGIDDDSEKKGCCGCVVM